MSSHHIVKEKQEPALLILDLADFDEEHLGQLLEWSPTILVNEESAEKLHSLGIKFDVLLTEASNSFLQDNLKVISVENNVLESAFGFLLAEGYPAVNLITGKRSMDDFRVYATQINLVIYSGNQKIYSVHSGFKKWKPAGEIITISNPPKDLQQNGLEKINDHQFKILDDGFFTLNFEQAFLFISEEI